MGGQLAAAASAAARIDKASTPELPGLFNMFTRMAISVLRCQRREGVPATTQQQRGKHLLQLQLQLCHVLPYPTASSGPRPRLHHHALQTRKSEPNGRNIRAN
jgi:hypothetical protein